MPFPRLINSGRLSVLFTLALCACGCAHDKVPIGPRDNLRQSKFETLRPIVGRTRVTDVQAAMGGPDFVNEDGSFAAYYWETITDTLEAGVLDHDDNVFNDDRINQLRKYTRHLLALRFDEQGVLQRHRYLRLKPAADLGHRLDVLASKWGVPAPVSADRAAAAAAANTGASATTAPSTNAVPASGVGH